MLYIVGVCRSEIFLSALQNLGVEFLHGVKNFHQDEVLFLQAAYNIFHAAENAIYAALAKIVFRHLYKNLQKMPIMKNS